MPSTQAGSVGVSAYVSGSSTDVPITYSFDSFSVRTSKPVPVGNYVPTSAFTSKVTDLQAVLDGAASSDVDGTITSWAWSFGDGSTSTGAQASHTYATAGTKDVTLTVTDDKGATSTTTSPVVVTAPNKAPVAAILATTTDLKVVLDGSTSTDPDGTIASYAWNFGDGDHRHRREADPLLRQGRHLHRHADGHRQQGRDRARRRRSPPSRSPTWRRPQHSPRPPTGLALSVDGSTSTDRDGTVASYAWTFGDGSDRDRRDRRAHVTPPPAATPSP